MLHVDQQHVDDGCRPTKMEAMPEVCKDQLNVSTGHVQETAGIQQSSVPTEDECCAGDQGLHNEWSLGESPLGHTESDHNPFGLSPQTQKSIRSLQTEASDCNAHALGIDWEAWAAECLADRASPPRSCSPTQFTCSSSSPMSPCQPAN